MLHTKTAGKVIVTMILCLGLILTQDQLSLIQKHWVNEDEKFVTILIDPVIATGTDGACEIAAWLFHSICLQGYTLYVIGPEEESGYVPSLVNPMTLEWTKVLIEDEQAIENAYQYDPSDRDP